MNNNKTKKRKTLWKLPNGEDTYNVDEMISAWEEIYKPIEKAFDLDIMAYDPDLMFINPENKQTVTLPLWFAKKLLELIKENKK